MTSQLKTNCIESLKKDGPPIIIVAAVQESEAVLNSCKNHNIKVSAFCDSIKGKTSNLFCGLKIIHTPSLPDHYKKARFIIASQHIQDCIEQLTALGFDDFYSPLELIENYKVNENKHIITNSYMEARLTVCKNSHRMFLDNEDKTYMRSLDVMITTRCGMKCEGCSNLMQYYTEHKNFDHDEILNSIDLIKNNVDQISEFRLIGGEPLMNKSWAKIANSISLRNPENEIFIYSNGTIAPKDEQLESFQGKKISFIITEYGKLSRNLDKLHYQLKKYNINFVSNPATHWVDCSNIRHHKRTNSELEEVFKQCCVKYLYTLLHGKLYRCPFIANAANLKAIPDNPANYVELKPNDKDIKKKIRRLIKVAKFFPACDFCDGRPYDATSSTGYDGKGIIEAGIQVSEPISYKQYD